MHVLSTRAVHIELLADQSTPAFLAGFRHFTSRLSLPSSVLYSDNGTNFVRANCELKAHQLLLFESTAAAILQQMAILAKQHSTFWRSMGGQSKIDERKMVGFSAEELSP